MKASAFTRETIRELGISERNFPDFQIGDTIAVHQNIKEGDKERIQIFEGDVIARANKGASSTFIVRKMGANSVSVEKIFPYFSPLIHSIVLVRRGEVRRAKLYYLRDRVGKAARIREKVVSKAQRKVKVAPKK